MPEKHCWKGIMDDLEFGTDAWLRASIDLPARATCMLPDGHDGPHEWTPNDQIRVNFKGD